MPDQLMKLCPAEYEIMLDSKIKLLKLQNPMLAAKKDDNKQTAEEQMQMINTANVMMGGSTI